MKDNPIMVNDGEKCNAKAPDEWRTAANHGLSRRKTADSQPYDATAISCFITKGYYFCTDIIFWLPTKYT